MIGEAKPLTDAEWDELRWLRLTLERRSMRDRRLRKLADVDPGVARAELQYLRYVDESAWRRTHPDLVVDPCNLVVDPVDRVAVIRAVAVDPRVGWHRAEQVGAHVLVRFVNDAFVCSCGKEHGRVPSLRREEATDVEAR